MRYCRKRVKKRRIRRALIITLLVLTALIVFAAIFVSRNVNPVILSISDERVRAMTNEAVSGAVLDVMSDSPAFDYMTVARDKDGNIQSVDIDARAISDIAQRITIEAQRRINESGQNGIKIPLGSLSGVTLFTGMGPDVNIKMYLTGSTKTQILSVFSHSGINQTLHRLYLNVSGTVAVAIPGIPSNIETETQVLMSEMIIVGEVPPTYLQATSIGDMLDLVVD